MAEQLANGGVRVDLADQMERGLVGSFKAHEEEAARLIAPTPEGELAREEGG